MSVVYVLPLCVFKKIILLAFTKVLGQDDQQNNPYEKRNVSEFIIGYGLKLTGRKKTVDLGSL